MIPKTTTQQRHVVRNTLASVRANLATAIAKLTIYDVLGAQNPSVPLPDIFREVDEAWAELNKLSADLDEGKIRLG